MTNKGTHLTEEVKEKIRQKLLGRRCSMGSEFKRGRKSWNKGTKGLTSANKTSFKKGDRPKNYTGGIKSNGKDGLYIRVGNGKYFYKKNGKQFSVGKYESLARHKYREAYGDFPKEMIVSHKDGDIYNNEIENLELISRAENLKRNNKPIKKRCFICGIEFLGRTNHQKICSKKCKKEYCYIYGKEYNTNNKEKINDGKRKYRLNNRQKVLESQKKFREKVKAERELLKVLINNDTTKSPQSLKSTNTD